MIWTKPWQDEYEALLERMKFAWEGEIVSKKSSLRIYSIYKGDFKNYKYFLMINDLPYNIGNFMDAYDNVKYIQLQLFDKFKFNFFIRHETKWDKFHKIIGLEADYSTGNSDYDKRYLIHIGADGERDLMNDFSFQQYIKSLDTFGCITMKDNYFMISKELKDKNQLTLVNIESLLNSMVELADYTGRRDKTGIKEIMKDRNH